MTPSADRGAPRVLLVRLSAIGDVLHGLPVLNALRDAWPRARIAWAVERPASPLLEGHPSLDELIVLPRGWLKSPGQVRALRPRLRAFRADVSIDLQGLARSAVMAWLSGARRRIGFGCDKGRELSPWLNNELVRSTRTHIIECNLELLRPLGIESPPVRFGLPESAEDRSWAESLIQSQGLDAGFAVINPGAGWPSKLWPADRFAAVAARLGVEIGLPSLVVWGGEQERRLAERIVDASQTHARLAPSSTLRQLAAIARRAAVFVASDTGPLHLAAAVGTPCVGLFGPMPGERNGPYGPAHATIQKARCDGTRRRRRASPALMEAIEVDDVVAACKRLAGERADSDAA